MPATLFAAHYTSARVRGLIACAMPETEHIQTEEDATFEFESGPERMMHLEDTPLFSEEPPPSAEPVREAPILREILTYVGGEREDWDFVDKGSGYLFDGKDIINRATGEAWVNTDADLHDEMLRAWSEGGSPLFRLPDYREPTDDGGEILFVTHLILGDGREVSYEIWSTPITGPRAEIMQRERETTVVTLATEQNFFERSNRRIASGEKRSQHERAAEAAHDREVEEEVGGERDREHERLLRTLFAEPIESGDSLLDPHRVAPIHAETHEWPSTMRPSPLGRGAQRATPQVRKRGGISMRKAA